VKQTRGMGRVYQQKGSARWSIGYYVQGPDGRAKEVRESSGSTKKSDAVALLRKRTGQIANGAFVEPVVQKTTRLSDLERLVTDNYRVTGLRSSVSLAGHFKRMSDQFGDVLVAQLGTAQIEAFKASALERYKPASINRSLAALKRGFKLARRSGLVVTEPVIEMLREDNARQGFLEDADFRALCDALPKQLRDAVTFLYLSGWRPGEMKSLEWSDVDLPDKMIRLRPEHSKNKLGRKLPLSGELLEVIKRAHSQRRLGCPFVFHRDGHPIGSFRKAWATACKIAKLGHVLTYDMRRSAVRNFVRAGIDQTVAMARSGHKTVSVFQRYNITSEDDMRAAAEKLDNHLAQAQRA
jgi:integrase